MSPHRASPAPAAVRRWVPAVLALAAWFASAPAQAQWVWKDANGQVHASDLPPPRDVPTANIVSRPIDNIVRRAASPAPAAAASGASSPAMVATDNKPRVDPELEVRRRKVEQEQAAKKKAEDDKLASQRADNCQRARSALASLESGVRMVRTNASGEREVLDDKARNEEIARARAVVAADCR
ncbi:hypothetical protein BurJ1DRAFT_3575 [Burkholderiales bacterium JOSHI_001]|nr:hypothetical protein BurJ1DRAFT_3575 [Burkholderiales bacterium JOSHI_001]